MQKDLFRIIFNQASDAIVVHRVDGTIVEANDVFCRVTGLSRERILGSKIFDFPDMRSQNSDEAIKGIIEQARRDGHAVFERAIHAQDGSAVSLEVHISLLDTDEGPLILSIARDLTARRKAEQDLRESDEKFRNFANLSSDGIYLTDEEGRVVAWNPAMAEITGISEEDARGKNIWDLHAILIESELPPDMLGMIKGGIHSMLHARELPPPTRPMEGRFRRVDGTIRYVQHSAFPVRAARGNRLGGITRDITEQKRHEEALQESEERYRLLTENVKDVIYRVSLVPELRVEYASPAIATMLGFEPGQVAEALEWAWQNIHPDDRAMLRKTIASGSWDALYQQNVELRFKNRDGAWVWASFRNTPITDSKGDQIGLEGVGREITPEKKAEEALRYRVRAEGLVSSMSTEFLSLSGREIDGHLEVALGRIGELAGMDRCYIFARSQTGGPLDLVSWWVAPGVPSSKASRSIPPEQVCYFERYLSKGEMIHLTDASILLSHSSEVHTLLAPQDIKSMVVVPMVIGGELRGFIGFDTLIQEKELREDALSFLRSCGELISSVIERRNMERVLSEERERLAVTLRSIGDGVITTDVHGRVMLMNRVAEDLTGWRQEEAVGKPLEFVFKILNEETRDPCESPIRRVLQANDIITLPGNTLLIDREDYEKAIADSAAPITDREGRTIGVVLVFRDVTGQRRMEEALINAQKLEAVGTLAGGIAHDFNNILTIILGNISAAKLDAPRGSRQSARLIEAEKGVARARGLTQQLLTFSEGGEPVKKVVPMAKLITDTIPLLVSGSKVLLEMDVPEDLAFADIDEGQISQVLGSIAINSVEAMPGGGRLSVEARNVCLTKVNGPGLPEGSYVRISIRDNGPGMPKHILSNIFEPYFTTKKKGNGLGLSIAYSVIKKHAGSIEAISEYGHGAEFVLLLPAAAAPEERSVDMLTTARVLILDDEESILEVTSEILRHLGYEVDTAAEGKEALEKYRQAMLEDRRYDVVIMDLTIPGGMGGKEAIKHLLAMDPKARAIVSSGYSNDPVMSDFRGHGFVGVVPKPYRLEELEEAVRASLLPANG